MESESHIHLRLLGGVSLDRNGNAVHGRAAQKRRLAIVILLAASPSHTLTRDRIVGLLWPESEPEQARKLLSEALYVLRRELGESLLESRGDQITLQCAKLSCDLLNVQDATARADFATVVSAYGGPFLDGWYVNEAPDFERWVDEQRARLVEEYSTALSRLISGDEAAGRVSDAASRWRKLVETDPHRSSYAVGLAHALAISGERPAALLLLAQYKERLRNELQVEPDDEVLRLERRLRRDGRLSPDPTPRVEPVRATRSVQEPEKVIEPAIAPRTFLRNRSAFAAATATVVLLFGSLALFARPSVPAAATFSVNRLAVLYFRDGSAERDLTPTADVITEALIEQLAGVNAFEVVPVSGVKRYRSPVVDVDSVAHALNAGSVVDGTVQRIGERLVVSVRLINTISGAVAWSSHYEGATPNLLDLQRQIAADVASAIRQRLGTEVRLRELRVGTANERARQLVARGNRERDDARELLQHMSNPADVSSARQRLRAADSLYKQAHAEDRKWVRPLVEQGWTALVLSPLDTGASRKVLLGRAEAVAEQALALSATDATALELRGTARWRAFRSADGAPHDSAQATRAIADLQEAIGLDSTLARAWSTLSTIYWIRNQPRLSYAAGRRALQADTYLEDSPRILRNLISAALLRDTFDSSSKPSGLDMARQWCARGRAQFPTNWHFTECQLTIMKYDERARPNLALGRALVARLDSLDPPVSAMAAGHAYSPLYRRMILAALTARTGDLTGAREILSTQRMHAVELEGAGVRGVTLDLIPDEITLQLIFGDTARAMALMDSAIAARPILRGVAVNDPILVRAMNPARLSRW